MRNKIKGILGKRLSSFVFVLISDITWIFDARAKRSRLLLKKYKDAFAGEKCIIIGNGPSLNNTDLRLLRNIKTFGQNRIYLAADRIKPTFLVSVNGLVSEQFSCEMKNSPAVKFMSWANRKYFDGNEEDIVYLWDPSSGADLGFSKRLCKRVYIDSTVTFVSMQLAYWMGFSMVGLVGVDHYFSIKGENDKEIISKEDDGDHFDSRYFGKGIKWHLPNLDNSEKSYFLAKQVFFDSGFRIFDCTVNGRLEIFDKMKLEDFITL